MNNILSLVLITLSIFASAQNIEFEKVIDDNVNLFKFEAGGMDSYIRYQKLANKSVLRFEDLKVQLYDINFDRIWEIKLERLTGGTRGYNRIKTVFNDDFIYMLQYNVTVYRPGGSAVKSKLFKIDYEGNIIKVVNFKDIGGVTFLDEMLLIDEELFVIWDGVSAKNGLAYHRKESYTPQNISIFNSDLIQIKPTLELPHKISNTNKSQNWKYEGINNDFLLFSRSYMKNKNDKITTLYSDENTRHFEFIEVTQNLDIENFYSQISDKNSIFIHEEDIAYKYDTSSYHLEYSGRKYHKGLYPIQFSYSPLDSSNNLFIFKDGIQSENLTNAFTQLVKPKISYNKLAVDQIISDPINNNVNVILQPFIGGKTFYLCTFDDNMRVMFITHFEQAENLGGRYKFGHPYSYNFGCYKFKEILGEPKSPHIMNALEYSAQFATNSHVTILNYDDYQILIVDSLRKNTCTVYKFTK